MIHEPIISADGHVSESPEMWARVPEQFRSAAMTRVKRRDDGFITLTLMGNEIVVPPPAVEMDDELRAKEFRNDPTGGCDLAVRTQKQLLDGVHAEVVFPNTLLCIGSRAGGRPQPGCRAGIQRLGTRGVRAGAASATSPPRSCRSTTWRCAVKEAERCIAKGFRTLMLPCSYPWRPYDRPEYAPLWSLIEESGVVLNFHVFTGNVFFGTDFASVDGMSVEEFAMRRESARVDRRADGAPVDHRDRHGRRYGSDRAPHRRRRAGTASATQASSLPKRRRAGSRGRCTRWMPCSTGADSG